MTPLYEAEDLPTFQNRVYDTREQAITCHRGSVRLIEDPRTGLIYNAAFNRADIVYDENYQNEQANSQHFRDHLNSVASIIEREIGRSSIVEVGAGKGFFLEMLAARGFEITGCDPTYEGENPAVLKEYFTADLCLRRGSGIVLRHVLEHIQDPASFLRAIRDANGGQGKIYIEVPCFDWILDHRAWFDVYYEHVNYFRLSDFQRMFGTLHFAGRTFGGQYLSIVGDLSTLQDPVRDPACAVAMPADFAPEVGCFEPGAIVWGGGSKGVIFSIMMGRAKRDIAGIVDINPLKQGKFLPVSGLMVERPEEALSRMPPNTTVYVMNGNYLAEIERATPGFRCVPIDLPSAK